MSIEITDANFKELVLGSTGPVLLKFWAEWCGPCKALSPIVEELATEYGDRAVIAKVDVDNNPNVSSEFGIRNIPTILFFKNGKIVDKQVGMVPKSTIEKKLRDIF